MPLDKDANDVPVEDNHDGRFTEQEEKAAPGRLGKYLASRLVDKPSIGESMGRRKGRRGRFDIDIPTGGKPGTRNPTGSRRDPDRDGWADEGTTRPVWVGIPGQDGERGPAEVSGTDDGRRFAQRDAARSGRPLIGSLASGGSYRETSLKRKAESLGVSLDSFFDTSTDDDDISESTSDWSLSKVGKQRAGDAIIVRTNRNGEKEILTITRQRGPFRGAVALPGGLFDEQLDENLQAVAGREMMEEVNIDPDSAISRLDLGTIDSPIWDPRFVDGAEVAATRFDVDIETSMRAQAGDDASKFEWISLDDLSRGMYSIAFGHAEWLARAFEDDEELGARFDVLSEASTLRNARLITSINDVRRSKGQRLFKDSDIKTSRLSSGRKIPLSEVTRENVVDRLEELTGKPATDKQVEVLDETLSQAMLTLRSLIGREHRNFSSAFESTGQSLVDEIGIEVSRDGIPFVSARPIPQFAEQIPDKRDWREVELPTRVQVNDILESAKDELAHYYVIPARNNNPEQHIWTARNGDVIARAVDKDGQSVLVYENSEMEERFPLLRLIAPDGKASPEHSLDYRSLSLDLKAEEDGTYSETSSSLPPEYLKAWKKHSEFLRELARRAGALMGDEKLFSPENERVSRPGVVDESYLLTYIAGLSNPLFFNMGLGGAAGQSYHDLFGHLGTGRSFDRHGEWANDLAMFSIVDHPDSPLSTEEKEAVKQLHMLMYSASRLGIGRMDDGIQPGLTDSRRVARRLGGNLMSTLSDAESDLSPNPNANPNAVWFAGRISGVIDKLDKASASNRLSSGRASIDKSNDDDLALALAQDILGFIDAKEVLSGERRDYDIVDSTRLASGDIPRFPREPAYGPMLGGAEDVFKNIDSWEQFKERYDNTEIVFLDYETTGLNNDPFGELIDRGKPVQIGAVRIKNGQVIDRFNVFVNPGEPLREWSAKNLRNADGLPLTDEYLSGQISIQEAHAQLAEFIGQNAIVGVQYAPFDKNVLEDSLLSSGIDWRPRGYIDTNSFADLALPKWTPESPDGPINIKPDGTIYPSTSLKAITEYLGVELGDKHHSADADALATAQVMQGIIDNAIKKSFSTDALSKTRRDKILARKRGEWIDSVEDFRAAKEEFNAPTGADGERLSSGAMARFGIGKRKPPRKSRTTPGKKYKYGDKDDSGKEIRKTSNTWLRGLTAEQIADVLVPASEEEMIEMWADDFFPGWRKSDETKNFVAYFREQLDKYPVMRADFSPESVEAMRNLVSQTLNSNKQLKWMFENFGAPNFFMSTKEGMDWYHNQPDVAEAMERLRVIRGTDKPPYTMGMSLPSIDSISFNRRALIDREPSNGGEKLELFMSETDDVIPGDTHISKSLAGILVHEYGHWLINRADEDAEVPVNERNRSYYGSGSLNDPRYVKALEVSSQYMDSGPNEELIGLFESGVSMDMTPDKPRLTTSYGHTTLAEAFAEGFVAVMHPNRDIQMRHINKKLRDDVYALMGGDENFKPWDEIPERAAPGRPIEARNSRRARILSGLRQLTGMDRLSSGAVVDSEIERISLREDARQKVKDSLLTLPQSSESASPGRRRLRQLLKEDAEKIGSPHSGYSVSSKLKASVARSIAEIIPYTAEELSDILNERLSDDDVRHIGTFTAPVWTTPGGYPSPNIEEARKIFEAVKNGDLVVFYIDEYGRIHEKSIKTDALIRIGEYKLTEFSTATDEGMLALKSAMVSEVVHSWAISANNQNAEMMSIQHEARNLFGLDDSLGWSYDEQRPQAPPITRAGANESRDDLLRRLSADSAPIRSDRYNALTRDILLAMYERTQEYYRSRGITHIPVWRGYTGPYDQEIANNGAAVVPARLRPLSSWSIDNMMASEFARGQTTSQNPSGPEDLVGMVVMAYVPVEDVLCNPITGMGCLNEDEAILLGRPRLVIAKNVVERFAKQEPPRVMQMLLDGQGTAGEYEEAIRPHLEKISSPQMRGALEARDVVSHLQRLASGDAKTEGGRPLIKKMSDGSDVVGYAPGLSTQKQVDEDVLDFPGDEDLLRNPKLRILSTTRQPSPDQMVFEFAKDSSDAIFKTTGELLSPVDSVKTGQLARGLYGFRRVSPKNRSAVKKMIASDIFRSINMSAEDLLSMIATDEDSGSVFAEIDNEFASDALELLRSGKQSLDNFILVHYAGKGSRWNLLSKERMAEAESSILPGSEVIDLSTMSFDDQKRVMGEIVVSATVATWAHSSTAVGSRLISSRIRNKFNLRDSIVIDDELRNIEPQNAGALLGRPFAADGLDYLSGSPSVEKLIPYIDKFIEAVYKSTQNYFASKGITHVPIWRGMNIGEESVAVPSPLAESIRAEKTIMRPLSSWSVNRNTALSFGGLTFADQPERIVRQLFSYVPVENIFSTPFTGPGALIEDEIVLIGKPLDALVFDSSRFARGISGTYNASDRQGVGPFNTSDTSDVSEMSYGKWLDEIATRRLASGSSTPARKLMVPEVLPEDVKHNEDADYLLRLQEAYREYEQTGSWMGEKYGVSYRFVEPASAIDYGTGEVNLNGDFEPITVTKEQLEKEGPDFKASREKMMRDKISLFRVEVDRRKFIADSKRKRMEQGVIDVEDISDAEYAELLAESREIVSLLQTASNQGATQQTREQAKQKLMQMFPGLQSEEETIYIAHAGAQYLRDGVSNPDMSRATLSQSGNTRALNDSQVSRIRVIRDNVKAEIEKSNSIIDDIEKSGQIRFTKDNFELIKNLLADRETWLLPEWIDRRVDTDSGDDIFDVPASVDRVALIETMRSRLEHSRTNRMERLNGLIESLESSNDQFLSGISGYNMARTSIFNGYFGRYATDDWPDALKQVVAEHYGERQYRFINPDHHYLWGSSQSTRGSLYLFAGKRGSEITGELGPGDEAQIAGMHAPLIGISNGFSQEYQVSRAKDIMPALFARAIRAHREHGSVTPDIVLGRELMPTMRRLSSGRVSIRPVSDREINVTNTYGLTAREANMAINWMDTWGERELFPSDYSVDEETARALEFIFDDWVTNSTDSNTYRSTFRRLVRDPGYSGLLKSEYPSIPSLTGPDGKWAFLTTGELDLEWDSNLNIPVWMENYLDDQSTEALQTLRKMQRSSVAHVFEELTYRAPVTTVWRGMFLNSSDDLVRMDSGYEIFVPISTATGRPGLAGGFARGEFSGTDQDIADVAAGVKIPVVLEMVGRNIPVALKHDSRPPGLPNISPFQNMILGQSDERLVGGRYRIVSHRIDSTGKFGNAPVMVVKVEQVEQRGDELIALTPVTERLSSGAKSTFKNLELLRDAGIIKSSTREDNGRSRLISEFSLRGKDIIGPNETNSGKFVRSGIAIFRNGTGLSLDSGIQDNESRLETAQRIASWIDMAGPNVFINTPKDRDAGIAITMIGGKMYADVADIHKNTPNTLKNADKMAFLQNQAFAMNLDEMWSRGTSGTLSGKAFIASSGSSASLINNESVASFSLAKEKLKLNAVNTGSQRFARIGQVVNLKESKTNQSHPDSFMRVRGILANGNGSEDLWLVAANHENISTYKQSDISRVRNSLGKNAKIEDVLANVLNSDVKPVSKMRTASFGDNNYEVVEVSSNKEYRGIGIPSVAAKLHNDTYGENRLYIPDKSGTRKRLASGDAQVDKLEESHVDTSSQLVSLRSPKQNRNNSPSTGLIDGLSIAEFLAHEIEMDISELMRLAEERNEGLASHVIAKKLIAQNITKTLLMRGNISVKQLKQIILDEAKIRDNIFKAQEEAGYLKSVVDFLTELPRNTNERIFSIDDRIYPLDSIVRRAKIIDEAWALITRDMASISLDELLDVGYSKVIADSRLSSLVGAPGNITLDRYIELLDGVRTKDKTRETLERLAGSFDVRAKYFLREKIRALHEVNAANIRQMRADLTKRATDAEQYEYFVIDVPVEIQAQRVTATLTNPSPTRKMLVRKRPFDNWFTGVPDGVVPPYSFDNDIYIGPNSVVRKGGLGGTFATAEDLAGVNGIKIDSSNIDDPAIKDALRSYLIGNMEIAFVDEYIAGNRFGEKIPGASSLSTDRAIAALRELLITGSIGDEDKAEINDLVVRLVGEYEKFGKKFSLYAWDSLGELLGKKIEINKAGSPKGEEQILRALVAGIISQWATTSNSSNPMSLTVQHVARQMFGLDSASGWIADEGGSKWGGVSARDWDASMPLVSDGLSQSNNQLWLEPVIREVLTAQYMATQQYFRDKGIKTLRVWRGQGNINAEELQDGAILSGQGINRPLSSWSSTPGIALSFADGRNGNVIMADVPVEDILSIPLTGNGCLDEDEVVLLGKPRNIIVMPPGTMSYSESIPMGEFKNGLRAFGEISGEAKKDLEQALPLMKYTLNKTDDLSIGFAVNLVGRVYAVSSTAFTIRDQISNRRFNTVPLNAPVQGAVDILGLMRRIRTDMPDLYPSAENHSFLIKQLNKSIRALDDSLEMLDNERDMDKMFLGSMRVDIEGAIEAIEDVIAELQIDIETDPDKEYIDTDRASLVDIGYVNPRTSRPGRLYSGSSQVAERVTDPIAKRVLSHPMASPILKLGPTDNYEESKATGRPLSWILPHSMDKEIADIISSFIDMFAEDEGIQKLIGYNRNDDGTTGITPTELFRTDASSYGGEIFKPGQTVVDFAAMAMMRIAVRARQIDPSITNQEARNISEAIMVSAVPSLSRAAYVRFESKGDSDAAIKLIDDQVSEIIRQSAGGKNDVFIRVPADSLKKIASSGVIKSQFESGRSEAVFDPSTRARTELGLFGYHPDMPAKARPIYGMVAFGGIREESFEQGEQYGGYMIVLNRGVNDRTTFTQGDSLSLAGSTSAVNEPTAASLWLQGDRQATRIVMEDTLRPITFDKFNEAQVHSSAPGERTLTVDDIDYVLFDDFPHQKADGKLPDYVKKQLKRLERELGKPILKRSELVFGRDDEPGSGGVNREYIEKRRRDAGLDRLSSGLKDREKEIDAKLRDGSTTTDERREMIEETLSTVRSLIGARALQDKLRTRRVFDDSSTLVRGPRSDSDIVDRDVKAAVARMIPTSQQELEAIVDENPYSFNNLWPSDEERRNAQLQVISDARVDWDAQKKARAILEDQIQKYPVLRTMIRLFDAPPILVTYNGGLDKYANSDGSEWANASGYYSYRTGLIMIDRSSFADEAEQAGFDFFPPEPDYLMIHELGHAFHHMAKMTRDDARESELRAIENSQEFLAKAELRALVDNATSTNESTAEAIAMIRFGVKMMHPDDYELAGLIGRYAQTNRPEYVAEAFNLIARGYGEEPFREHVDLISSAFGLDEEETIDLVRTIEETRDFQLQSGTEYLKELKKIKPAAGNSERLSSGLTSEQIINKAKDLGINWRESNVQDTPEFRKSTIEAGVGYIKEIAGLGAYEPLDIPGPNNILSRVEQIITEFVQKGEYDLNTQLGRDSLLMAIGGAVGPGTLPYTARRNKSVNDLIAIAVPQKGAGGTGETSNGHRAKFAIMKAIAKASGDMEAVERIESFEQYLRELATKSDAEIESDVREAANFFSKSLSAPLIQTRDATPAIVGIGGLTVHDPEGRRPHKIFAMSPSGDSVTISARRKTESQWGIPYPGESAPENPDITKMRPISGHSLPSRGLVESRTRRLKQTFGDDVVVEYDFPVGMEVFEQVGIAMDKYGASHIVLKESVIPRTKISNGDTNTNANSTRNVVTNLDELSELSLQYGDAIGMLYAWKTGDLGSAWVGPLNPAKRGSLEYLETVTLGTFQPEEVKAIIVNNHRRSDIPGMLTGNEQLRREPGEIPEQFRPGSTFNLSLIIDGAKSHDELLSRNGPKLIFNVGGEKFGRSDNIELFNSTMTKGWVKKNSGTTDESPFFGIPESVLIPEEEPDTTPYEALLRAIIFARENNSASIGREIGTFYWEKRNGKELSVDDIKAELGRAIQARKSRPQRRLSSGYSTLSDAQTAIRSGSIPPQKIQIPDSMFNSESDKNFALTRYPNMHLRWDDRTRTYRPSTGLLDETASNGDKFFDEDSIRGYMNRDYWHPAIVSADTELARVMNKWRSDFADSRAMARALAGLSVPESRRRTVGAGVPAETDESFDADVRLMRDALSAAPELGFRSYRTGYLYSEIGTSANVGDELNFAAASVAVRPQDAQAYAMDEVSVNPNMPQKLMFDFPSDTNGLIFDEVGESQRGRPSAIGGERGNPVEAIVSGRFRVAKIETREFPHPYSGRPMSRDVVVLERMSSGGLNYDSTNKQTQIIKTDGWVQTGRALGSQPGGKFQDPETGKEYYVKEPRSRLHAENESLVTRLYERLGVRSARVSVGERNGRPQIVSEWLVGSKIPRRDDAPWRQAIQESFVANAWLANWDATGNPANIVEGADGMPYIVDAGGGLLFRARGEAKGSRFGRVVGEMESLKDPSLNPAGSDYFKNMQPDEIARQVGVIAAISDDEIEDLVMGSITDGEKARELIDVLIARRDYLIENWSTGRRLSSGAADNRQARRERVGRPSSGAIYGASITTRSIPSVEEIRKEMPLLSADMRDEDVVREHLSRRADFAKDLYESRHPINEDENPDAPEYWSNILNFLSNERWLIENMSDDEFAVVMKSKKYKSINDLYKKAIAEYGPPPKKQTKKNRLSSGGGGRTKDEQEQKTKQVIDDINKSGGGIAGQWGAELAEEYAKMIGPVAASAGHQVPNIPPDVPLSEFGFSTTETLNEQTQKRIKAFVTELKQKISSWTGYPDEFIEYIKNTDESVLANDLIDALVQMHNNLDKRVRVQMDRRGISPMLRDGYKTAHELGSRATADQSGYMRRAYETYLGIPNMAPVSVRPVSGYMTFQDMNSRELDIKAELMRKALKSLNLDIDDLPESLRGIFNPDNIDIPGYEESRMGLGQTRRFGHPGSLDRALLWRGRSKGMQAYGSIEVVLRPEVSARSVYTHGDSLNNAGVVVPVDSTNPMQIFRALSSRRPGSYGNESDHTKLMMEALLGKFTGDYSSSRYGQVDIDESGKVSAPSTPSPVYSAEYTEALVLGAFDERDIEEIRIPIYDVPNRWAKGWSAVQDAKNIRAQDRETEDENEDVFLPESHYSFLQKPGILEELGFSGAELEMASRIVEKSMSTQITQNSSQKFGPEHGLLTLADGLKYSGDDEYGWTYSTLKRIAIFEMNEEMQKRGIKLTITTQSGIDLTIPKSATAFRHGGDTVDRATDADTWREAIRKRIINDLRLSVELAMKATVKS